MPGLSSVVDGTWRKAVRPTPITILMVGAAVFNTLLVPTMFLWYLISAFFGISQGSFLIAELVFPSVAVWILCVFHATSRSFAGHIAGNIIALLMVLIAFPCILLQGYFLWPGMFDGKAGVPQHTPLMDQQVEDSIWIYIIFGVGMIVALLGNLMAGVAFLFQTLSFVITAVSGSVPVLGGFGTKFLQHIF